MDGEGAPGDATLEHALYWRQIYTEILAMEEKVLDRIRQLMNTQSEEGRREVELTNVPVVVAQAERFRQRLGYWEERITQLDGNSNHHQRRLEPPPRRLEPPPRRLEPPQALAGRREGVMRDFLDFVTSTRQDVGVINMRRSLISLGLAALVLLIWPATALAATLVPLGTAGNYAVLAGTTVTNTGPTWITGQVGLAPGTSVTGFPPGTSGNQDVANAAAGQAKADLTTGYLNAAGQTPCTSFTPPDLGGRTLVAGTYCSGTAGLTGTLTLDGGGVTTGVWLFQLSTTLITSSGSRVMLINGAQPCDVFWQVGSSATIGTSTVFVGNILALTTITMQTGATLNGRAPGSERRR